MITPQVDTEALADLNRAISFWTSSLGKDAEGGVRKAARLITLGLHRAFRAGAEARAAKITPEAKQRGYTMADSGTAADRFDRSRKSAAATLGSSKSAFFRIQNTDTGPVATPLVVGRKGVLVRASRKNFAQRGNLLSSLAQLEQARRNIARGALYSPRLQANLKKQARIRKQLSATQLPADAVRLNVQSLAVVRQLKARGRAARGSYLAAQFLTYKKMAGAQWRREGFITKNNVQAGEVAAIPGRNGGLAGVAIRGFLPGTADRAAKIGAADTAFRYASGQYQADIREQVAKRFAGAMGFAIKTKKNRPIVGGAA